MAGEIAINAYSLVSPLAAWSLWRRRDKLQLGNG
jgi:hypothetical protein